MQVEAGDGGYVGEIVVCGPRAFSKTEKRICFYADGG